MDREKLHSRLLPLILLLTSIGCAPSTSTISASTTDDSKPLVRIRLLESQTQLYLTATSSPLVHTTSNPTPRPINLAPGTNYAITLSPAGWIIGSIPLGSGQLTLKPSPEGSITLNQKLRHRGIYRLVPVSDTAFDVINDIDLESYLHSVVTRESPAKWSQEALKAQAIVARTYALYEAKTSPPAQKWDMFPDTRSQVYGGIPSETPEAIAAVENTTGIVTAYGPAGHERIFKAYFSSCCGGITQSAVDVFGGPDIPPLAARSNYGLCASISTKYHWETKPIEKTQLTDRIKAWAKKNNRPEQNMAALDRIEIQTISPLGRPTRFLVTDSRANRFSLKPEDLRHAINFDTKPTTLFSSFVTITHTPTTIQFTGRGSGHGVGMCQWCTQAMAKQGYPAEAIVAASFPHTILVRAY